MAIIERQLLFARLAVDGKQAIHERDDAFQLRVGGTGPCVCTLMASMNPRLACARQQAWIMSLAPMSFS